MKNTTKTITIPATIDAKTLELFYAYAKKRGIKIEDEKTAEVKSAPKKKNNEGFDRDKYEAIAKKCGVMGKHGVWKSCRQYIYDVMNGKISVKKCAELCAEFASNNGWKLNK